MFLFRKLFSLDGGIYFNTPDPASGGGAGTVADGVQPGAQPGQGAPPQQQGVQSAGFRQNFPNVPDEHWALIEPHIGQVEAYTTQLQQQLAPFKSLVDAGYTPDRVQGLVNFETRFEANPLETWVELGKMLQQPGGNGQSAVHPDVDLDYLAAIARGEDPEQGAAPGIQPGAAPVQPGADGQTPEMQALLQHVQSLQQRLDQAEQTSQQQEVARQTAIQDQVYDRRLGQMREALTQGGWPEDLVSDEMLGSQIIIHRGDFAAATKALLDQRANLLKGFVANRQQTQPTDLPNGVPGTASRDVRNRDKGDSFKEATNRASARLARLNGAG